MLNRRQLRDYRELRGLSYRDVAKYCDISHVMISYIENGERDLTERVYREIVAGINAAYQAKKNGKLLKWQKPKDEKSTEEDAKQEEIKPKKATIKKSVNTKK